MSTSVTSMLMRLRFDAVVMTQVIRRGAILTDIIGLSEEVTTLSNAPVIV